MQELDSEAIARAILAASWRGVHVELFLEQEVDSAECEALAKRMKAEVERIIASSKTYTP